jgi:hypothetical protein
MARNASLPSDPFPFPLPRIVWAALDVHGVSVTYEVDVYDRWGGALASTTLWRQHCPLAIRKQIYEWIHIQKERRRLGLPYLQEEEMEPVRRSY